MIRSYTRRRDPDQQGHQAERPATGAGAGGLRRRGDVALDAVLLALVDRPLVEGEALDRLALDLV